MKKTNKKLEKVKPFEVKCKDIFIWAGYKPHTKFHAARYPLIGDWNSWQRLEDCLTILFKGQTPFDTTSEHAEHVLDVIISSDQNWDKFRLMKTSMNTIAFIDAEVNKMENLVYSKWISKLKLINGSLAIIHFDKANATDAADEERGTTDDEYQTSINQMIIIPQKNEARSSSASPSPTKLVSLIHDNSVKQRKEMDMLSVAFGGGGLAEIISIYQERCIQKVMDDCVVRLNTTQISIEMIHLMVIICVTKRYLVISKSIFIESAISSKQAMYSIHPNRMNIFFWQWKQRQPWTVYRSNLMTKITMCCVEVLHQFVT